MHPVTFDHYLAGIVGLGLIRHWYADGEANDARMTELADVLSKRGESPYSLELSPAERSVHDGYAEWAASYDGRNPMIELEEAVVVPILERLAEPGLRALDAGCGTGRHTRVLDACGCATTGIDPTVAIGELARVLAPGGTLVIADPHPIGGILGGQAYYGGVADGRTMTFVRNHRHGASTWLRAFRTAGLEVADCIEAPFTDEQINGDPSAAFHPEATRAACTGLPSVWVWELGLPG